MSLWTPALALSVNLKQPHCVLQVPSNRDKPEIRLRSQSELEMRQISNFTSITEKLNILTRQSPSLPWIAIRHQPVHILVMGTNWNGLLKDTYKKLPFCFLSKQSSRMACHFDPAEAQTRVIAFTVNLPVLFFPLLLATILDFVI